MENPEQAINLLNQLREIGISLAIDDFGTGYSSLAYLKRLPIQTLKLDREFVKDLETDGNNAAISAATIALAHNLGFKVVAEGVETQAQQDFLIKHQCDMLQGFLYDPPQLPERIEEKWL
jgi:EAL domain-containing protein (putative c-di-GMP-specific phosphodiesterase class I)